MRLTGKSASDLRLHRGRIAKLLDHALLKPTLTDAELEAGCRLALEYDVASVCIVPHALARCAELLAGSSVQPSTTIGFPHGSSSASVKLAEAPSFGQPVILYDIRSRGAVAYLQLAKELMAESQMALFAR